MPLGLDTHDYYNFRLPLIWSSSFKPTDEAYWDDESKL